MYITLLYIYIYINNVCVCVIYIYIYIYIYMCVCIYTVGMESIQTPLNFSLFVILQPFAKSSFDLMILICSDMHCEL